MDKCKVLINNNACTVVDVAGAVIQFPPINRKAEFVNIICENDTYKIGADTCEQKEKVKKTKKKVKEVKEESKPVYENQEESAEIL